ncbi:MAG TPA: phosphoribosyltransferase family protein [Rhizomicrobium sp.]|nr:phosphoribosyltransferase family protein [Rhizomicrobium sp.]
MARKQAVTAEDQFLFRDRIDAGQQLAERIAVLNLRRPLVLALPRGGVPIGIEIAKALRAPLDLLLVRKIGLPWQPELAVGAVLDGTTPRTVINDEVARHAHMDEADIAHMARVQLEEIEHRRRLWLSHRAHVPIRGRGVIVADDGVATGATMRVALDAVRKEDPARLVLATPVVPQHVAEILDDACDDAVFLAMPEELISVGMYYKDFHQLHDDEVKRLLNRAWEKLPDR